MVLMRGSRQAGSTRRGKDPQRSGHGWTTYVNAEATAGNTSFQGTEHDREIPDHCNGEDIYWCDLTVWVSMFFFLKKARKEMVWKLQYGARRAPSSSLSSRICRTRK